MCGNVSEVHFVSRPGSPDVNTILEYASNEFMRAAHPMLDRNDPATIAAMPVITWCVLTRRALRAHELTLQPPACRCS